MSILGAIILATVINGLVAFAGAFTLFLREKTLQKILIFLVAFSAGALLGGAFLHLIPESLSELPIDPVFGFVLLGFAAFFLIEKFLHWHHCHDGECKVHPVSSLILFGDGIHNFIDGLIIATSFFVDIQFGIITTIIIVPISICTAWSPSCICTSGFRTIIIIFMTRSFSITPPINKKFTRILHP